MKLSPARDVQSTSAAHICQRFMLNRYSLRACRRPGFALSMFHLRQHSGVLLGDKTLISVWLA